MIKIDGFSKYKIDKSGFVESEGFKLIDKRGRKWTKLPRKMWGIKCKSGYFHIRMKGDDGINSCIYIHRLVAKYFIPNPDNLPIVNHIDGDPSNNHYKNLEWCTQSRNMEHSYYDLKKQGKKNRPIKQLDMDGNLIKIWPSAGMASRRLGFVSTSSIFQVLIGRSSYAKGFRWQYQ